MNEAHLRAVFLMLAGENVAAVSARSGICRTSFYKLRRRAVTDAVRREIENPVKNKKPARNRPPARECISEIISYKNGFQSHIAK